MPWLDVGVYALVYLCAAILLAVHPTGDPRLARCWRWLAAAVVSYAVGNLLFSLVVERAPEPSYPSIADVFYLAWYPLTYVGLLELVRGSRGRAPLGETLDGLISGLGVAALATALVTDGALGFDGASRLEVLVNLAYPLGDLLLLALLAAGGSLVGRRGGWTAAVLAAGLAVTAVADLLYLVQESTGDYVEGDPIDLLWLLGVAAIAVAAYVRAAPAPDVDPTPAPDVDPAPGLPVFPPTVVATVTCLVLIGLQQMDVVSWPAVVPADLAVLLGTWRAVIRMREWRRAKAFEVEELQRLAHVDDLTGLPNRRGLAALVSRLCAGQPEPHPGGCILVVDVDQYAALNGSLGHALGEQLLCSVAERLRQALPPDGLLARIQGGEFALVVPRSVADAEQVARTVISGSEEPIEVGGLHLHVALRVGVASSRSVDAQASCSGFEEVLRLAGLAAGRARSGDVQVFTPEDHKADLGRNRLRLLEDLRGALDGLEPDRHGVLVVHFQPQVRLASAAAGEPAGSRTVVGAEALVRWQHPHHGLLLPGAFLPLAADAGLMRPLTDVVLDAALAACSSWWAGCEVPVAVNVSVGDLLDRSWGDRVVASLDRHGLPARALVLELTEETLLTDPRGAATTLAALRRLGVLVSIDDYGTAYSSLAYLQDLPADELKLDQVFARRLRGSDTEADRARAIVRSTADLAHCLGMRLVVEGVEDEGTLGVVTGLGADVAQGFHIARPMPVADWTAWLAAHQGSAQQGSAQHASAQQGGPRSVSAGR